MTEVTTIGLDLAKNVFQAHGADAAGAVMFREEAAARSGASVSCGAAGLHGCHGGLRRQPLLGTGDREARA